jgi:hypothetical protein
MCMFSQHLPWHAANKSDEICMLLMRAGFKLLRFIHCCCVAVASSFSQPAAAISVLAAMCTHTVVQVVSSILLL